MKTYLVTYRYTVEGNHEVEAKSAKEAKEKIWSENYGDSEKTLGHRALSAKKI